MHHCSEGMKLNLLKEMKKQTTAYIILFPISKQLLEFVKVKIT